MRPIDDPWRRERDVTRTEKRQILLGPFARIFDGGWAFVFLGTQRDLSPNLDAGSAETLRSAWDRENGLGAAPAPALEWECPTFAETEGGRHGTADGPTIH